MSTEPNPTPGGYSRLGTIIFVLVMLFPFVTLGWELARTTLPGFLVYGVVSLILLLAMAVAVRYAPSVRRTRRSAALDPERFDSEQQGVPW